MEGKRLHIFLALAQSKQWKEKLQMNEVLLISARVTSRRLDDVWRSWAQPYSPTPGVRYIT